jgi:hypothetical protein
MHQQTDTKGFIALISVLMLSVVLLAAVISLAQYGITSRYALLHLEHKTVTLTRAQACVEVARIAVVNDPFFETTNKEVVIDDATCILEEVFANTPASGFSRIEATARLQGATTNVRAEINTNSGDVVRFEEVPNF